LTFDLNGPSQEGSDALTLPRSNPNNVLFVNRSDDYRRLSLDLGTRTVADEEGVDEVVPFLVCTTLIDTDSEQNKTITIGAPSIVAPDGYSFFVPGVESARLELVVP